MTSKTLTVFAVMPNLSWLVGFGFGFGSDRIRFLRFGSLAARWHETFCTSKMGKLWPLSKRIIRSRTQILSMALTRSASGKDQKLIKYWGCSQHDKNQSLQLLFTGFGEIFVEQRNWSSLQSWTLRSTLRPFDQCLISHHSAWPSVKPACEFPFHSTTMIISRVRY